MPLQETKITIVIATFIWVYTNDTSTMKAWFLFANCYKYWFIYDKHYIGGGVAFHRNAFSPKQVFTERPFHRKGGYSSLGLFTECTIV